MRKGVVAYWIGMVFIAANVILFCIGFWPSLFIALMAAVFVKAIYKEIQRRGA